MPKLPGGYTAKLDGGTVSSGRRATGEDFSSGDFTGAAHKISAAAEGFLDRKEEDDSRGVLVGSAEVRAKYAKRADEAATSGEDLGKIREELDADLAKIAASVTTKKGLETAKLHAASTGSMFDNQANSILVHRARVNAKLDGDKFLNSEAQILSTNPSYLPQAEKNIDDFIATLGRVAPEHKAELADNLKKRANYFAVQSAIRQSVNPSEIKAQMESGKWNLSPEAIIDAQGRIKEEERGRRADAEYQRVEAERKERNGVELAEAKWLDEIKKGKATWNAIRDDPAFAGPLGTNTKKSLMLLMEARARAGEGAARKEDESAKLRLFLDINRPNGDPQKIYNSTAVLEQVQLRLDGKSGGIGPEHASWLMAQIAAQKDPNGQAIGGKISTLTRQLATDVKGMPEVMISAAKGQDLGARIANEYTAAVLLKMDELRKTGAKGVNPEQVFDPKSDHYVGGAFKQRVVKEAIARAKEEGVAKATTEGAVRANTPAERDALPPGTTYVGPDGNVATTQGKKAAPPVSDIQAWIAATGGALKPGQTQAQAVAEWKAKK